MTYDLFLSLSLYPTEVPVKPIILLKKEYLRQISTGMERTGLQIYQFALEFQTNHSTSSCLSLLIYQIVVSALSTRKVC